MTLLQVCMYTDMSTCRSLQYIRMEHFDSCQANFGFDGFPINCFAVTDRSLLFIYQADKK